MRGDLQRIKSERIRGCWSGFRSPLWATWYRHHGRDWSCVFGILGFHSGSQSIFSQTAPYLVPSLVPSSAPPGSSLLQSLPPQPNLARLPAQLSFCSSVYQHPELLASEELGAPGSAR